MDAHRKNRKAFHLGYADYERGMSQHHCPFGDARALAWGDGWMAAFLELVDDPAPWGWLPATHHEERAKPEGER